jgi:hypothetical protein
VPDRIDIKPQAPAALELKTARGTCRCDLGPLGRIK